MKAEDAGSSPVTVRGDDGPCEGPRRAYGLTGSHQHQDPFARVGAWPVTYESVERRRISISSFTVLGSSNWQDARLLTGTMSVRVRRREPTFKEHVMNVGGAMTQA